jgi:very-short-patch-repair endonuclease
MSQPEETFAYQVRLMNLPEPKREYRFYPARRWKSDFAWLYCKLLVEIEGGVWTQGRHTRGKGYQSDIEKYNTAQLEGWTVLRFTPSMVDDGSAINQVKRFLDQWSIK